MKITTIEAIPARIPLTPERRMISALGKHAVSEYVLVRLRTDAGVEGAGEATVTPRWSGETVWSAQAIIARLFAPELVGVDPRDIAEVERRLEALAIGNPFARSAIEMACWDAAGRAAGVPVFELLGGAQRPLTVRSRFSLGAYPPAVAAERAGERVAAGFDTIKVKVGTGAAEDVERVRAVRAAVGPGIRLTIDANGGWDEPTALRCLEQLADCRLDLVEQPLPRGNYTGLCRLRDQTGVRILADESCFTETEAQELIAHGCSDALSVYPGKQGGIAATRRIVDLAARHGLPCSIGSNLEWDVATAAMLHAIAAMPNLQVERYPGDCLGPSYHEVSIAREPLAIEGPLTTLPARPGLGVEVDWERVESHRIRDGF
jgi:muconate cycloisomerase